jgi:hypothetical protein
MSADTCIAYFGLRFEVGSDEIEGLELRSDERVSAARRVGLKYYWGNFGGLQDCYLMFIGAQLGIMGSENSESVDISAAEFRELIDKTKAKLIEAGFEGTPSLHLQWQPDV